MHAIEYVNLLTLEFLYSHFGNYALASDVIEVILRQRLAAYVIDMFSWDEMLDTTICE